MCVPKCSLTCWVDGGNSVFKVDDLGQRLGVYPVLSCARRVSRLDELHDDLVLVGGRCRGREVGLDVAQNSDDSGFVPFASFIYKMCKKSNDTCAWTPDLIKKSKQV